MLESVLRRWTERVLAAANRLGKLVPAAGHLVHKPSHIYAPLGHRDPAAAANAAAVAVDRAHLKGKPANGLYSPMYYPHYIDFPLYAQAAPPKRRALSPVAYHCARRTRAAVARVAPKTVYDPVDMEAYLTVATASLEARIADAEGDSSRAAAVVGSGTVAGREVG